MVLTPFEKYLQESLEIDKKYAAGEISADEARKQHNLLKINVFFPKIANILKEDLEEQKKIDEEFGYMGGNYE